MCTRHLCSYLVSLQTKYVPIKIFSSICNYTNFAVRFSLTTRGVDSKAHMLILAGLPLCTLVSRHFLSPKYYKFDISSRFKVSQRVVIMDKIPPLFFFFVANGLSKVTAILYVITFPTENPYRVSPS